MRCWLLRPHLELSEQGSIEYWRLPGSLSPHVRFGSKADIEAPPTNVRFTPKSGHWCTQFMSCARPAVACRVSIRRIGTLLGFCVARSMGKSNVRLEKADQSKR